MGIERMRVRALRYNAAGLLDLHQPSVHNIFFPSHHSSSNKGSVYRTVQWSDPKSDVGGWEGDYGERSDQGLRNSQSTV